MGRATQEEVLEGNAKRRQRILDHLDAKSEEQRTRLKGLSRFEQSQIVNYDRDYALFTDDGWIRWWPSKIVIDSDGPAIINQLREELDRMAADGLVDLLRNDTYRIVATRRPR